MKKMTKYKNPTCRGCYQFGTACGHCEKCVEERARTAPKGPPGPPTAEEYATVMIGMEIADGLGRDGESPRSCAEKIIQRLKETGIVVSFSNDK